MFDYLFYIEFYTADNQSIIVGIGTINDQCILVLQTWQVYERRELVGLVDTSLDGDFDAEEACKFLKIGLLCTQDTPKLRPSMSSVVKMLRGEKAVDDNKITKPGLITDFMDLKVRPPQNTKPGSTMTTMCTYNASSGSDSQDNSTLSLETSAAATSTFISTMSSETSAANTMSFTFGTV